MRSSLSHGLPDLIDSERKGWLEYSGLVGTHPPKWRQKSRSGKPREPAGGWERLGADLHGDGDVEGADLGPFAVFVHLVESLEEQWSAQCPAAPG